MDCGWDRALHTSMSRRAGSDNDGRWAITGRLPVAYRALTVQSAAMSSSSRDRAEARRRARMAARGELPPEPDEGPEREPTDRRGGGFLGRLFPATAPLPNKPDPLAGFDESGPLRPLRVRAFLLRQNLGAWILTGVLAFLGYSATLFFGPESFVSLLGTFVQFGALIAAGWFGWQRPTLYGTAAGVLAYVIVLAVAAFAAAQLGVPPDAFAPSGSIAARVGIETLFLAALGFIGGWYGGYLRRRQAQLSAATRRR